MSWGRPPPQLSPLTSMATALPRRETEASHPWLPLPSPATVSSMASSCSGHGC